MSFIPELRFDTGDVAPRERYDYWQDRMSALFEIAPGARSDLSGSERMPDFFGRLTGFHLGPLLFGRTETQSQSFGRSPRKVARDGLDHFLIQGFLTGGGPIPSSRSSIGPGDIYVIDMAQPHHRESAAFDNLNIVVPRDLDPQLSRNLALLHERTLRGDSPIARVLMDLLRSTFHNIPDMTLGQAQVVSEVLLGMLRSGTGLEIEDAPQPNRPIAFAIRQYIEDTLGEPLDIEALAARFRVSRAYLYRLFETEGGVRRYVQRRRLRRAMLMLTRPETSPTPIGAIAFECGFTSEAQFSRAFRAHFDISPTEARLAAGAESCPPVSGNVFATWLETL